MSDRNTKTWARLRAILSRVTVATIATTGSAAAADAAPSSNDADAVASPNETDRSQSPALQETIARELAIKLSHLPPIRAMGAVANLALSPETPERLALAGALAWEFPLVGEDVVLDHLSRDAAADVRAATARAAWIRRATQIDTQVLHRLLGDDDPEVRAAAWLAVRA